MTTNSTMDVDTTTEVIISEKLTSLVASSPSLGLLVGLERDQSSAPSTSLEDEPLVITGHFPCSPSNGPSLTELTSLGLPSPDWSQTREVIAQHCPVGCGGVGVCVRGEGEVATQEGAEGVLRILWTETDLKSVFQEGPLLVAVIATTSDQSDCSEWCYMFDTDSLTLRASIRVSVSQNVEEFLQTRTVVLRVQAALSLSIPTDSGSHPEARVSSLTEHVNSSSSIFYLPSQSLLLTQSPSRPTTLSSLLSPAGKKDVCQRSWQSPIAVELLEDITMDTGGGVPVAPVLHFETGDSGSSGVVEVELPLDVVCVFGFQTSLAWAVRRMKEGVRVQIEAMAKAMELQDGCPRAVTVSHLPLPTHHTPVTMVMPRSPRSSREKAGGVEEVGSSDIRGRQATRGNEEEKEAEEEVDKELEPLRRHWRRVFGLPDDRPFFRTTNRKFFQRPPGPHLINVHTAVKHSRVPEGSLAVVQGCYAYHHYMQESFNDNGWGCAYRSLQTLWSWFILQGYTSRPVPSHREIQQVLVDVGDKPPSLVGSKEWIGSFEVSTCLNHLLGVESKIHHCSSGAAMAGVGRVLIQHFQTQGTPIMIGGGVLAHTILGVDFSEKTGEIRFLILDPHYTGRDDLKTIVDKGWCGWKPVSFWDQQAHYNLCMPQRPTMI